MSAQDVLITFRRLVKLLGPKWLVRDEVTAHGETKKVDSRVLFTVALYFDATRDRVKRGIAARFPGGGSTADSLHYIGRDRQTVRGPSEPVETFVLRLQRAIDDWRVAGTAWSVLEQIRAYCYPHAVRVRVVNNHGNYYQIDRDGTRSRGKGLAWNWDAQPTFWSRFWVEIYVDDGSPWVDTPVWGSEDEWGGVDYTWGSTALHGDVAAIQKIVRARKPLFARCVNIIVIFDDEAVAFELDATAPPAPDGTWGIASKNVGGVQVPSRSDDAIYWDG